MLVPSSSPSANSFSQLSLVRSGLTELTNARGHFRANLRTVASRSEPGILSRPFRTSQFCLFSTEVHRRLLFMLCAPTELRTVFKNLWGTESRERKRAALFSSIFRRSSTDCCATVRWSHIRTRSAGASMPFERRALLRIDCVCWRVHCRAGSDAQRVLAPAESHALILAIVVTDVAAPAI